MKNRPNNLRIYLAVAATVALVALCLAACLYRIITPAAPSDTTAATRPGSLPSYEDTLRDEQHRWGHGHTLADPSPSPP